METSDIFSYYLFGSSAAFTAIFYFFPVFLPFFSPFKREFTNGANFSG
jgi:hypothetical protein